MRFDAPRPSVPYTNGPASRPPVADASLVSSVAAAPSASTLRTLLSRGLSNFAVRVRCKKQHAVRLLGFDQALGQTEAVHVARASEIDVDRTAVPGQTEAVLNHAGSGRQKVVRRLRAVDHVVDVGGRCAARRE